MPANSKVAKMRWCLVVGGYTALVLTFALTGVTPCVRGTIKARAAITQTQQGLQDHQAKQSQLIDIEKSIELINRQVAHYPQLVPENQNPGDFLSSLSQELHAAGLKDMDHKALASVTMGRTQKLAIELRGSSSFEQFHAFLRKLEQMDRKCSVGRLVVESDANMSGKVSVNLTLYIFNSKPGA